MSQHLLGRESIQTISTVKPDDLQSKLGDCYEVAANITLYGLATGSLDEVEYLLCHGTVTGQGHLTGMRFDHAWVEWCHEATATAFVADYSNGNEVILPVSYYYALGMIDPSKVHRYTREETLHMLLKHQHYGAWHDQISRHSK